MKRVLILLVGLMLIACQPASAKTNIEAYAKSLCVNQEVKELSDLVLFSATKVLTSPDEEEVDAWVDAYETSVEEILNWIVTNSDGTGSEDLVTMVVTTSKVCATPWIREEFLRAKEKYGKEI